MGRGEDRRGQGDNLEVMEPEETGARDQRFSVSPLENCPVQDKSSM